MVVKRGDIYYADLRPVVGSEQGGAKRKCHAGNQCRTDAKCECHAWDK